MKLGPIAEWGLNMDKKTIEVNSENFETSKEGIFAADLCSYPGKLKLTFPAFMKLHLLPLNVLKELGLTKNIDLNLQPIKNNTEQIREKMIELLTANTPNGRDYYVRMSCESKLTKIDINKKEQFKPEFKIGPFAKFQLLLIIKIIKVF